MNKAFYSGQLCFIFVSLRTLNYVNISLEEEKEAFIEAIKAEEVHHADRSPCGVSVQHGQDLDADVNPTVADHIAMLGHHRGGVHEQAQALPAAPQPPPQAHNVTRVQPPQLRLVDGKLEEADWEAFEVEWANFKNAGNLQICTEKLGETYNRVFGRLDPSAYASLTE